jgi:hypothetical protein
MALDAPRNEIELVLKDRLYNSACQAIIRLYRSENLIIKIFWTLGLLTASALCCYFVIYALAEYLSYEVTSTTRVHYETTSLFPKVTFCNVNPYTTKSSYQLANETTSHEAFMNRVNYNFNTTQRDTLSHSLDDILLECSFNTETCDSMDFFTEFTPNYGACYTFNAGLNSSGHKVALKESLRAGASYGLQFTMYINVYEKLKTTGFLSTMGGIVFIGKAKNKVILFLKNLFV